MYKMHNFFATCSRSPGVLPLTHLTDLRLYGLGVASEVTIHCSMKKSRQTRLYEHNCGTFRGHHINTPHATEHPIAKVTKTTTLPCSGGSTEMPAPAGTPATSTYDD